MELNTVINRELARIRVDCLIDIAVNCFSFLFVFVCFCLFLFVFVCECGVVYSCRREKKKTKGMTNIVL